MRAIVRQGYLVVPGVCKAGMPSSLQKSGSPGLLQDMGVQQSRHWENGDVCEVVILAYYPLPHVLRGTGIEERIGQHCSGRTQIFFRMSSRPGVCEIGKSSSPGICEIGMSILQSGFQGDKGVIGVKASHLLYQYLHMYSICQDLRNHCSQRI